MVLIRLFGHVLVFRLIRSGNQGKGVGGWGVQCVLSGQLVCSTTIKLYTVCRMSTDILFYSGQYRIRHIMQTCLEYKMNRQI